MRALLLIAASLLAFGATACSGSGSTKDIEIALRIAVWPEGPAAGKPVQRWGLRCNPLGGNLPHGDRACYLLTTIPRPFAPVPAGTACSQVYGGPQEARVAGRFRGRPVDALFRRTDGCQTARWNRVDFLFPEAR